jgi:crossover junction endodeoxyribonuclease RusA
VTGQDRTVIASFTVDGRPVPKGRPRVTQHGTYTPQRTRDYERRVGWGYVQVSSRRRPDPDAEFAVTCVFHTASRADVDNLAKAVLDGLNGVAWKDDSQVVELLSRRVSADRSTERAVVTVSVLGPGAAL